MNPEIREITPHVDFDQVMAVDSSAGRMWLVTCTRCGAVVTHDPGSYRHLAWHAQVEIPNIVEDPA